MAILLQFLAIEPHFVRKGCGRNPEIAILPEFLAIGDRTSFRAKGLRRGPGNRNFTSSNLISCETVARNDLQIAILPQFLAIEHHFVRKGSPETQKSQFYLSVWRSNLISCESVAPDDLQIAILPQRLAIEPHFVRKGSPETRKSQFYFSFWR